MLPFVIAVDVLLIALLIAYAVYGYRLGLLRSLGGIAGFVAGGVAAFVLIPIVGEWIPAREWRAPIVIATAVLLLVAGHSLGASLGRAVRGVIRIRPLRSIDRVLGALVTTIVAALVTGLIGTGISALGMPIISPAVASSNVLRAIENVTPGPVRTAVSQARSFLENEGLPRITDAIDGGEAPPVPDDVDTDSPDLDRARESVVRVTGTAFSCGQGQTGSGVVVATDRVVTNAHVVAGVDEPVVEAPGHGGLSGRVVYFDPEADLAVIAVDGLPVAPLEFAPNLEPGDSAVVQGYPFGGPFASVPAAIDVVRTIEVPDIYGDATAPREVYRLSARVEQGNSGGPVLTSDGAIAGIVFGKAADDDEIGYAMTMTEVSPVIAVAPELTDRVTSGRCISA